MHALIWINSSLCGHGSVHLRVRRGANTGLYSLEVVNCRHDLVSYMHELIRHGFVQARFCSGENTGLHSLEFLLARDCTGMNLHGHEFVHARIYTGKNLFRPEFCRGTGAHPLFQCKLVPVQTRALFM